MTRWAILVVIGLSAWLPVAADEAPVIRWVEYDQSVNPISIKRITRAIAEAEAAGDEMVIIRLDTPGGLVQSLHTTVQAILNSEVPVVAWVAPAGAHAASAGFFMLVAADVAVMAPGTRTGAASTVFGSGESTEDNVMLKKMNEDGAALLRAIADRRGRDKQACEDAVFAAKAFEVNVALEKGLIDFVADDREHLLELLDGREVRRFDNEIITLHTAGAVFVESTFDAKHVFFEFLANPVVAYLLLAVGSFLVYFEFYNPGMYVPGIVGALCLALFAVAAMSLPVSVLGVLLIVLSAVLFLLELKIVSHGLLTLGGVAALIAGSLILIDGPIPALRVPPVVVLPVSILISVLVVVVMRMALRAASARVATGVEGLQTKIATVVQALDPRGKVFVHGETWNAISRSGAVVEGAKVRVVQVDDMLLTVEPLDGGAEEEKR
jgi:membrane-bound serine protease (ClpP class)